MSAIACQVLAARTEGTGFTIWAKCIGSLNGAEMWRGSRSTSKEKLPRWIICSKSLKNVNEHFETFFASDAIKAAHSNRRVSTYLIGSF
jgi:hypothetical protein